MNYRFSVAKATEAAALFIQKAPGHRLNVMKLVKLIYLLDRLSISRRGIPVVGGVYYSMRNGPVTSELLDLVNAGRLAGDSDVSWEQYISDRENHDVILSASPGSAHLAPSEIQLIDEIFADHGARDQWQLRAWCHDHCGEWTPVQSSREKITVEDIALNTGHTPASARLLAEEATEASILARALALG